VREGKEKKIGPTQGAEGGNVFFHPVQFILPKIPGLSFFPTERELFIENKIFP
jgi:hypothetical protein